MSSHRIHLHLSRQVHAIVSKTKMGKMRKLLAELSRQNIMIYQTSLHNTVLPRMRKLPFLVSTHMLTLGNPTIGLAVKIVLCNVLVHIWATIERNAVSILMSHHHANIKLQTPSSTDWAPRNIETFKSQSQKNYFNSVLAMKLELDKGKRNRMFIAEQI